MEHFESGGKSDPVLHLMTSLAGYLQVIFSFQGMFMCDNSCCDLYSTPMEDLIYLTKVLKLSGPGAHLKTFRTWCSPPRGAYFGREGKLGGPE